MCAKYGRQQSIQMAPMVRGQASLVVVDDRLASLSGESHCILLLLLLFNNLNCSRNKLSYYNIHKLSFSFMNCIQCHFNFSSKPFITVNAYLIRLKKESKQTFMSVK